MGYIITFAILIIVFILYVKFENTNLEVTHYKVKSKKLGKSFSGTTFVVIADLHNNSFGNNNDILIREINKINPSFIIIAGDLIIGKKTDDFSVAVSFLEAIAAKYPVYYGFGNHEQRVIPQGKHYNKQWRKFLRKLKELNIHLLDNDSIRIVNGDECIAINGLSIDLNFFQKHNPVKIKDGYLENLIGKLDKECYNIVIAHNPFYFKDYTKINPDLIISGHIHGGIVRLPFLGGVISPQYEIFPTYDAGQFEEDERVMLVSRGLGTHTIKLRVFNRPELMTVTLERDK